MEIRIYVLQSPKILADGVPVTLPYKKAEALVYYMAVEKHVTRDQAAALLWGNCEEATAKKNLRHALYTIRKSFHFDFITSSERQALSLNPEMKFFTDYDDLVQNGNSKAYEGAFLGEFYVKHGEAYEEWLEWKRSFTRDFYLRMLEEQLQQTDTIPVSQAEILFEKYVKEDPLEEQVYLYLMRIYEKDGLYYKGIRLYQKLEALLNLELKVSPRKEIRQIHQRFLKEWNQETEVETEAEIPDAHTAQLKGLLKSYRKFLEGRPQALLLEGEAGCGKTYLAEELFHHIQMSDIMIFRTMCMETEKEIHLQPWNIVMIQLAEAVKDRKLHIDKRYLDAANYLFPFFSLEHSKGVVLSEDTVSYTYRAGRNLFLQFLVQTAQQIPFLLFFDNIQYMDEKSLELLSLLVRTKNSNIMILLSCCGNTPETAEKILKPLFREKYVEKIPVGPFTKEEVQKIAKKRLGSRAEEEGILEWLYQESRGNAFHLDALLEECAKGHSVYGEVFQLNRLLKQQLDSLSPDTRQVLELIACCQAWADLTALETILERDSLKLLEELEELKERGFICEKKREGQIRFYICHGNMRKFIHDQMPPSKVRVFHSRLADYIEHMSSYDATRMERLIYHYSVCENREKTLKYKILSMGEYSRKFYEMYPFFSNSWSREAFTDAELLKECEMLEQEILGLYQRDPQNTEFISLYILLLQTKAQYCIPQGHYEEGMKCIKKALQTNQALGNDRLTNIRCLRFLIYHRLNTWELSGTEPYIRQALLEAREGKFEEEYAVLCRLYGLYLSMTGKFEDSMKYLEESLGFFESQPLKARIYAPNISACYNYMGETRRKTEAYEEAVQLYKKAIDVCESNQCSCNAVVYSNLGRALWATKKREESRQVFYRANEIYEESFTLIGRSITKAYISILKADEGEFERAEEALLEAQESAGQLASPYSLGILYGVKAKLKKEYPAVFADVLKDGVQDYKKCALEYLRDIPGAYERKTIESI